jgi:cysteine desulfurase
MPRPVYLDHHATTPLDPRVREAMEPALAEMFGNPASREHAYGWQAEAAVEIARERMAALIGAEPAEIVFTSGATEANNLALKGVFEASRGHRRHLISVETEHSSVLDPLAALARRGAEVTHLPVDGEGRLRLADLRDALREDTILVSVMAANNEIGTVQPLAAISEVLAGGGVLLHTDAAQAVGRIPVDVRAMGIDLMSISGHKLYAPKGVGALFVRRGRPSVRLVPLQDGGGHERGLRSGTLNVPGIVGLGAACEVARAELETESARIRALRDRLEKRLRQQIPGLRLNGAPGQRLPGNLSVSFEDVDGGALIAALGDVAVSSGAACASADPRPSHVLRALGVPDQVARATIRIGIGRFNTESEIDHAAETIVAAVNHLRNAPHGTPKRRPTGRSVEVHES